MMRIIHNVVLAFIIVAIYVVCTSCPNGVGIGSEPPHYGMFEGKTGWSQLKSAPAPLWTGIAPTLYSIGSFESSKNIASSSSPSYRVHPAESVSLKRLKEFTPRGTAWFHVYPEQYRDGRYLQVGEGFGTHPVETIDKSSGDKSVCLLKFHNLPSGRWIAQTKTDTYFIEVP